VNTPMKQESGSPTLEARAHAWFGCMAMMLVAAGVSGGCKLPRTDAIGRDDCPTGQCDPDPNGLGIYVAENDNYCFWVDGAPRACPEAFINTPQGVVLKLRDLKNGNKLMDANVEIAYRSPPRRELGEMTLVRIDSTPGDLSVRYTLAGTERIAQGVDLAQLKLSFFLPIFGEDRVHTYKYEVLWSPLTSSTEAKPGEPQRYEVQYRQGEEGSWMRHCEAKGKEPVASLFLPARRVDGLNAEVTDDPAATTLSCESGAIGTCLSWGYTPWDPETSKPVADRDYLFRSCLQAKRAAYFVGHGDLRAYTESGTEILRRDEHGYGRDSGRDIEELTYLEAIWTPKGAECLNMENRRRNIKPPDTYGVPPCPTPPQWSQEGKLATGVLKPLASGP
jgi:hypothetical protein